MVAAATAPTAAAQITTEHDRNSDFGGKCLNFLASARDKRHRRRRCHRGRRHEMRINRESGNRFVNQSKQPNRVGNTGVLRRAKSGRRMPVCQTRTKLAKYFRSALNTLLMWIFKCQTGVSLR